MRKAAVLVVCTILMAGHSRAGFARHAECARSQLVIRQIAQDAPGMSHSNAFFAILNKGRAPCRLNARYVHIGERKIRARFADRSAARFILPPSHGGRSAKANEIIGFNVSNDGASGPTRGIETLYFKLAKYRAFKAQYRGYDTSPFAKRAALAPFSAWKIFPGDECMVEPGKVLSFTSNPRIDIRTPLLCG